MTRAPLLILLVATTLSGASPRAPGAAQLWVINESGSLPRGLYRRTSEPPAPGRLVVLSPPVSARAYLTQIGARPDGKLLKRVAAGSGDRVCRSGTRVAWSRGAAHARTSDRTGRRLPAWRGCRRLAAQELFVMGDSPASFDSRYFGPVERRDVHGVYREAWTW